ncbi:MAG: hypothetical protein ACRDSJ_08515, partial [Rubrobacteraceae bacterium]
MKSIERDPREQESPTFGHYLIVRREVGGLELPHLMWDHREDVLPVFSSRRAAERFLDGRVPGDGWYVREFSNGEMLSLLFAFCERIAWTLPNPMPDRREDGTST